MVYFLPHTFTAHTQEQKEAPATDPEEVLALKREIEELKQKNLRWQVLVNNHVKK
jgi:hypothetical protein